MRRVEAALVCTVTSTRHIGPSLGEEGEKKVGFYGVEIPTGQSAGLSGVVSFAGSCLGRGLSRKL